MTEMKYIFPKQLQSVAALAFIAVLIALLLILTVMVHMRNRKLKRMLEEQMAERRLLDKICADFTAVLLWLICFIHGCIISMRQIIITGIIPGMYIH